MIALTEAGVVAMVVAAIAAVGSIIGALASRKVEQRTRTNNGHTIGEIAEMVMIMLGHHQRDPNAHKTAEELEARD